MIRVFVVSPSQARRGELRRALESEGVHVVGEADPTAIADAAASAGTVLVLDGEEALEAVERRDDVWPSPLVWLTGSAVTGPPDQLVRLGAPGWAVLPADAGPAQLEAAVVAASAGLAAVLADWSGAAASDVPLPAGRPARATAHDDADGADEETFYEALSAREVEVLDAMARGLSNRDIGARLGISEHTAKYHVASVLGKLGAHNRADAVRRGIRRGLVTV